MAGQSRVQPPLQLEATWLWVLRPLQAFLSSQSAGGVVLLIATLAALVWANSPLHESYHALWHLQLNIGAGSWALKMPMELFVNDGLMAVFFLMVGLEIKRELCMGELRSFHQAALPVAAAIGGMIAPALIYAAIDFRSEGSHGWGVPMATDIAFAVGVLALVGRGIPTSLKVFLLAVAIVDDLGAVLVIALFYTSHIWWQALGIASIILLLLLVLNLLNAQSPLPYLILGIGLWLAMFYSGIHATIAGALLAMMIPARRAIEEQPYVDLARRMIDEFAAEIPVDPTKITPKQSDALEILEQASQAVQTPLAHVEHALLETVNFLIMPLFALANAGLDLSGGIGPALHRPNVPGVLVGLFVGKPVGILFMTWITLKAGIGKFPQGVSWSQMSGVAVLCGIGFTMSLFIANLAFEGQEELLSSTKIAILGASLLAGTVGGGIIAWTSRVPR